MDTRGRIAALFERPADRRLMAAYLEKLGYRVLTAWHGKDVAPDLFIIDAPLARRIGHKALAAKREQAVFLPVLVALGSRDDAAAWLEAGFDDCLRMPVAKADLRARLQAFLRLRRQSVMLDSDYRTALSLSEDKYRLLAETAGDFIFVHDMEGRITYANHAGLERAGFSPEALGELDLTQLVAPDYLPMLAEHQARRLAGDFSSQIYEVEFIDARGQRVPIEASSSPIVQDGELVAVVVVARDLSERKRLLREAQQAAAHWQATFDAVNDAVWVMDREQRVLRANRASRDLLQAEPEAIVAKHCWPLVHGSARPVEGCPFVLARANLRRETMLLPIGDRYVQATVYPILDDHGAFGGAVHIFTDVTEQELGRQRDAVLTSALSGLHRCALLLEQDGQDGLEACLAEAHHAMGLELAWLFDARAQEPALLSSGVDVATSWSEAFLRQGARPPCVEQSREGLAAFAFEQTGACANCALRPSSDQVCVVAAIRVRETWLGALGGVFTRVKLQDQRLIEVLRVLADDISSAIATWEAKREQERLSEHLAVSDRLESVGRLAGGVAHDFNNLLTVIGASASFVEEDLRPHDPLIEDIRAIREATTRATNLTRQLLAFSRRQIIEPKNLEINAVVAGLESMLARLIGEDLELSTRLTADATLVHADPGALEQVVVNFATNARDAMPSGGKLIIETARVHLDEAYVARYPACRAGDFILLAVSDTGCGMDQATQDQIFEPFFTTKAKDKGTGLGLATVYGIVKQAGGFISVYSEPGEGTTFKVYLPAVHGEADQAVAKGGVELALCGTETILVVEDNAKVRAVAVKMLRSAHYRVVEADGMAQVMRQLEDDEPLDLILSDVVMPGGGGPEVVEAVRRRRPQVKALFMSGYTDDAIVHHGVLDAGIAFLNKPFSRAELLAKVREVLGPPTTGALKDEAGDA